MIAFSGVRSSCDMLARNSDFSWSALCTSRFLTSRSSRCTCSSCLWTRSSSACSRSSSLRVSRASFATFNASVRSRTLSSSSSRDLLSDSTIVLNVDPRRPSSSPESTGTLAVRSPARIASAADVNARTGAPVQRARSSPARVAIGGQRLVHELPDGRLQRPLRHQEEQRPGYPLQPLTDSEVHQVVRGSRDAKRLAGGAVAHARELVLHGDRALQQLARALSKSLVRDEHLDERRVERRGRVEDLAGLEAVRDPDAVLVEDDRIAARPGGAVAGADEVPEFLAASDDQGNAADLARARLHRRGVGDGRDRACLGDRDEQLRRHRRARRGRLEVAPEPVVPPPDRGQRRRDDGSLAIEERYHVRPGVGGPEDGQHILCGRE